MATKNNKKGSALDHLLASLHFQRRKKNNTNSFNSDVSRAIMSDPPPATISSDEYTEISKELETAAQEEEEEVLDTHGATIPIIPLPDRVIGGEATLIQNYVRSRDPRHQSKEMGSWMVPIVEMLGSIGHREVKASSISKVADRCRKANSDAYTPQVVSIGPLHRGTRSDLLLMEHPKWSYMLSLLKRTSIPEEPDNQNPDHKTRENVEEDETTAQHIVLNRCGSTVLGLDNIVRASYGGNIEAEPHELAKTMLVDGCFVLEFLLRLQNYRDTLRKKNDGISINGPDDNEEDPIFESQEKLLPVLSDLTLLENQVPFIVLKKLYRKLFPDRVSIEEDHRVAYHALAALGYSSVPPTSGAAHLLHLVHLATVNQEGKHEMKQAMKELKFCATRLRAAGITIKSAKSINHGKTNEKLSNLADSFDFAIKFRNGVLEIPPLHIKETTEVKWRNMIAWEQSLTGKPWKLTSYALFFQGLICSGHDIKLLEKKGVIVNDSKKSKEDLLKLFRKICEGVEHMDTSYSELCVELNNYKGGKPWKKLPIVTWHQCRQVFAIIVFYWKNWYQILIEQHIPTVWKLIGVLAAIALLVLTIMQTYYAAHSSHQ